ncbi:MAG: hypothetical protein JXC32_10670, partial [Anaerolineae bacterium]|nr:hypothetical protein [Anaerolineae bacterium]
MAVAVGWTAGVSSGVALAGKTWGVATRSAAVGGTTSGDGVTGAGTGSTTSAEGDRHVANQRIALRATAVRRKRPNTGDHAAPEAAASPDPRPEKI